MQINYSDILNIENKNIKFSILLMIILFLLLLATICLETENFRKYQVIFENEQAKFIVLIDDVTIFKEINNIKIEDKVVVYEILSYSEIYNFDGNYYQNIIINFEKEFLNNEIVEVVIYYDKEKMIKKIIDYMF